MRYLRFKFKYFSNGLPHVGHINVGHLHNYLGAQSIFELMLSPYELGVDSIFKERELRGEVLYEAEDTWMKLRHC